MHLGFLGNNPIDWKKSLPKLKDFNHFQDENLVFSIIRLNFNQLQVQVLVVFMDIALLIQ